MKFRSRDYVAEEAASSLARVQNDDHPLLTVPSSNQVVGMEEEKTDFDDPLRRQTANLEGLAGGVQEIQHFSMRGGRFSNYDLQLAEKEWSSFKKSLMQKFSAAKMVSVSSMSNIIIKRTKEYERSSSRKHIEELNDLQKHVEDDVKVITQLEYVDRLRELKDEIRRAWDADDRVTALKLSIKVAKLLMDTSVSQFYPTLFCLVTDVMDMLGDMVWERIKTKAEYAENGTKICSLPDNFQSSDVCCDAKETCNNWFCKIGSVHELLPRIYLELALLRCWRFLHDQPLENLHRLVQMIRGLADPLASAYCRVYLACCAQRLCPCDTGYLISCFKDFKIVLSHLILGKETKYANSLESRKLLIGLLEPAIGWILKCIYKETWQKKQMEDVLMELVLGRVSSGLSETMQCISIVLHHIIKELPAEIISSHILKFVQLIECSSDISFDQYLNYRLLGFRLYEIKPEVECIDAILGKVLKVITSYDNLDQYLKVVDAYLDIVLEYQMDSYLSIILDGISTGACSKDITENELDSLQSILIKLLSHFDDLEDVLALKQFVEILDLMRGSTRDVVNVHILLKGTRNGSICDSTTIQFLFEICQAIHDGIDISNIKDDKHQQAARLISHFVQMVDHGAALERHLAFLVDCRGAFARINDLKEVLVHSSNFLAIKALKDSKKLFSFVKSCVAFSEVTIPSIAASVMQMNLYLETAEVALLAGLVSHADGLIDAAVSCIQNLSLTDGAQVGNDIDGIVALIQKLFSLLVVVPGNPEHGVVYIPKSIISFIDAQPWITPSMRIKVFCSIISLSATLSQDKMPYHVNNEEVLGNDLLFFGDPNFHQELKSISHSALENLLDNVQQETHSAVRGKIALEACNCILLSFKESDEVSLLCSKLIEIAKSCGHANDKYLRSTVDLFKKNSPKVPRNLSVISA